MAGRHRRPSQTSLRLTRVGALTVMATAPVAVSGTALAAPSTAPEPESSRWADPTDNDWATWDDDTSDESDDDVTTTAAHSDERDSHGARARSVKPVRPDEPRGYHATLSRHDDSWDHRAAHARSATAHTARSSASAARSSASAARADSRAVGSRMQDAKWDRLAQCESGQNWDANTGNSYRGGLQFSDSTWRAYGGRQYAPTADQATREQQIAVARKVQQAQGWQAWPSCSRRLGYA
jgi:hypothetical protein